MKFYIRKLNINDFKKFKKIFGVWAKFPFYEAWTENDYIEEFNDFIDSGEIYGIFSEENIYGLITIKPKYLKWDELSEVVDVDNSIYLSDLAVCEESRGNGLGTKLMDYIVSNYGDNYDIYMRTNLVDSMSEGIAIDYDFRIYLDKIQEVSFKRTRDDIPETDLRKYLIRKRTNDIRKSA